MTTQGRLEDPKEFGRVIVKASSDGRVVRVRDVARVEMGARSYANNSYLNGVPAVGMGIFQRPRIERSGDSAKHHRHDGDAFR